jgi:hypothetical protein
MVPATNSKEGGARPSKPMPFPEIVLAEMMYVPEPEVSAATALSDNVESVIFTLPPVLSDATAL